MKTLDEVITALEMCTADKCVCVSGCPYSYLADGDDGCEYHAIPAMQRDALYYLKNYRDTKAWLDLEKQNYAEAVKNCERAEAKYTQMTLDMNRNVPLTWEQLKTMEGKPVFVEERYRNGDLKSSGWWLIDFWNDDQICMRDPAGNPWNEHRSNYGREWQAYRKERD